MSEQINIFEYMSEISFLPYLAKKMKEHCKKWHFDWLERLEQKKTVDVFLRHFCKVTKTYYFYKGEEFYGAVFSKSDETIGIYKCGKDYTGKYLAVYNISELLELM